MQLCQTKKKSKQNPKPWDFIMPPPQKKVQGMFKILRQRLEALLDVVSGRVNVMNEGSLPVTRCAASASLSQPSHS